MTRIKLVDGTILSCSEVVLENGALRITTEERTVEELAEIFSDKQKTSNITLMTESNRESGYRTGFTGFAGITYNPDGTKTIELIQPADVTEARISHAEGSAHAAEEKVNTLAADMQANLEEAVTELTLAMVMSISETSETAPETEVESDV